MWDDFQRFLDSLVTDYGVLRVLLGPFVAIGILAGTGIITGGAVSFLATGLSLFIALIVITALSLQLRSTRDLLAERARVVNLYTDRFAGSVGPTAFSVEDWDETVTINKRGDAVLERWYAIKVGDENLYSIWSGIYSGFEVRDSERRRVRAQARGFDEQRCLGAKYDVTSEWEGSRIRLYIHFEQPAPAREIVRIWIRWVWPGYYSHLLAGEKDVVEWWMHRPSKRINARMVFEKGCAVDDGFNITPYRGCPMPKQEKQPDGGLVITAKYEDVKTETKMGFWIDSSNPRR